MNDIQRLLLAERDPRALSLGVCELLVQQGYVQSAWLFCERAGESGPFVVNAGSGVCFEAASPLDDDQGPHVCIRLLRRSARPLTVAVHDGCCEDCDLRGDLGRAPVLASLIHGGIRYGVLGVIFPTALDPGDPSTSLLAETAADLAHALHINARERARSRAKRHLATRRLARSVGCELHDGLAVLRVCADRMANDEACAPPLRAHLRGVDETLTRLEATCKRLLAFAGCQDVRPRVLNLDTLIADLAPTLREGLEPGQRLEIERGPLPSWVSVDPKVLAETLLELVANARDAMGPCGRLVVTSSLGRPEPTSPMTADLPPRASWVLLEVRDDGPGVAASAMERVFDPCFTTREQRLGLGLSAVSGAMRQLGVHTEAISTQGRGCTLRLWFPGVAPPVAPAITPAEGSTPADPAAVRRTILLAEDDEHLRRGMRHALVRRGHRVLLAQCYEEALTLADDEGPLDLLVAGIVLPGRSGVDLARALRARQSGLPVLFISGAIGVDHLCRVAPETGWRFLAKPFHAHSFLRSVDALLVGPRNPQEQSALSSQPG
ncbi:MAG: response regulator [Pseudomonadota bacterium]